MGYKKNRYGSIILKDENGKEFTITPKEQKEIKTYVKRANQRRLDKAHRYYDDVKTQANMKGVSFESYMNLMSTKGFITEKYSSSMKQFKSKADVKDFLKELKTVTKRGYGDKRVDDIRKAMIERVNTNYGEEGKDIAKFLKSLDKGQLLSIYLHNDDVVQELYGSADIVGEQVEMLATKTMSDLNYYLKGFNKKKSKKKKKK